jgi:hypothetical protein
MPLSVANYQAQVISKGNILQHKKNSSQLTKKQKYAQICKGLWTNRTKSYATQTQTYTNPNTSNLLRVNYNNVVSPDTSFINGPYNYSIPYPNGCISDTIKDGGALLCNTIANPCTDEVIEVNKTLQCYSTTCSDVPGPEQLLCWDSQLDTWYPRQRYTMPTSGTGWPEGYKGFVSALKPPAPILALVSVTATSTTLRWTVTDDKCIPISSYNIYLNGQIYTNVPYTITSITIDDLVSINEFYVTSLSSKIESLPSNTISNDMPVSPPGEFNKPRGSIINLENTILLTWSIDETTYYPIDKFNIYLNDVFYKNVNRKIRVINIPKNILREDNTITIEAISGLMSVSIPISYSKPEGFTGACSCKFFNTILENSAVSNIITLLTTSNTILLDLSDNTYDIDLDTCNNLKIELQTFKETLDASCCLIEIIDLFQNTLINLYQSITQKHLYIGERSISKIYKDSYDILQDRVKLQEYINNAYKQITLVDSEIISPVITLKPRYTIYIQLYGIPDNLNFDAYLLTNVVNAINKYNYIIGIPENNAYNLDKIQEILSEYN